MVELRTPLGNRQKFHETPMGGFWSIGAAFSLTRAAADAELPSSLVTNELGQGVSTFQARGRITEHEGMFEEQKTFSAWLHFGYH